MPQVGNVSSLHTWLWTFAVAILWSLAWTCTWLNFQEVHYTFRTAGREIVSALHYSHPGCVAYLTWCIWTFASNNRYQSYCFYAWGKTENLDGPPHFLPGLTERVCNTPKEAPRTAHLDLRLTPSSCSKLSGIRTELLQWAINYRRILW